MANQITISGPVQAGFQDGPAVETFSKDGGAPVSKFRLKVSRGGTNPDGGDFFTVKCWRNLSDRAVAELAAGVAVLVTGKITNDRYKNKEDKWIDAWTVHATDFEILGAPAPAARPKAAPVLEEVPF